MTAGSRALRGILLALLALLPGLAAAHTEDGQFQPGEAEAQEGEAPPNAGYTGPSGLPYLSYYKGQGIYGEIREDRLPGQIPRNVRGDGDWLVWEDAARGDIFLYSVSAADGFYITNDAAVQRNPAISGGVVVWEDYRERNAARVYAYRIDSGETFAVSSGEGNHRNPSIDGHLVAWEDDRTRNRDVWGANLVNLTPFPVATSTERESDPIVLDGVVYYRTYRFNVWDVVAYEPDSNRTFAITSDAQIQAAPFTNGHHILFLTQDFAGFVLQRYDPATDRVRTTPVRQSDTARTPASGEHILVLARDVGYSQVIARNITSGATNHVTGNLRLVTEPLLQGKTAYLMVLTDEGVSLLVVKISDFAFSRRPSLLVHYPLPGAPWARPLTAEGVLRAGTQWTEPETFTYRINGGAPRAIPPAPEWRFQLDPAGLAPGAYDVTIRATFREGPPVETTVTLSVPIAATPLDVEAAAPVYHRAKLYSTYNRFVGENAAAWVIIPLALVLVALVAFRVFLVVRARKRDVRVEYVR